MDHRESAMEDTTASDDVVQRILPNNSNESRANVEKATVTKSNMIAGDIPNDIFNSNSPNFISKHSSNNIPDGHDTSSLNNPYNTNSPSSTYEPLFSPLNEPMGSPNTLTNTNILCSGSNGPTSNPVDSSYTCKHLPIDLTDRHITRGVSGLVCRRRAKRNARPIVSVPYQVSRTSAGVHGRSEELKRIFEESSKRHARIVDQTAGLLNHLEKLMNDLKSFTSMSDPTNPHYVQRCFENMSVYERPSSVAVTGVHRSVENGAKSSQTAGLEVSLAEMSLEGTGQNTTGEPNTSEARTKSLN